MIRTRHILFDIENVIPKSPYRFNQPISLRMYDDENWIIYGTNGSGKTYLIKTILSSYILSQGKINYDFTPSPTTRISDNILYLTFHDQYSTQMGSLYQLRWNQGLLGELESEGGGMPRVKDVLRNNLVGENELLTLLEHKLDIESLMEKYIISLSSGEFRRFQIAKILLRNPRLLIIENPYIGLDEENRRQVSDFLEIVTNKFPIQIILAVSRIPKSTRGFTHLIHIQEGQIKKTRLDHINLDSLALKKLPLSAIQHISNTFKQIPSSHTTSEEVCPEIILRLNNVSIRYGSHTILKDLNWEVKKGERWALQGRNGAGKSTLLSIVCADNPQSYRCDVTLFGRKRGTGESIWDIKKHIGFVSPEMFRSYRKPLPVENIIASGLYDTIGLYKNPKDTELEKITTWMRIFDAEKFRKRNYLELSDGEQRLMLLIRAFVKNPDLLILDEPFHGMDSYNKLMAKEIIELYCKQKEKTLIMVSHYEDDFPLCITNRLTLTTNQ